MLHPRPEGGVSVNQIKKGGGGEGPMPGSWHSMCKGPEVGREEHESKELRKRRPREIQKLS